MKVGELVAELTLNTAGFKQGMSEADKEIKKVEGDLKLINIGGAAAAGALMGLGAAAVHAANRAGEFADQINEVATVTGMSTDQVQRWKYAADQYGVSFDALTVSMRLLTQNIQSVDDENSELKVTLDKLGISAKDVNGNFRGTNELMLDILTKLRDMPDAVERNTLANKLYGRSWAELADFMQHDVDLAKEMAKADPISAYHLNQAEQYRNKMHALGAQFDQMEVKIGTKLIPAFSGISYWMEHAGIPAINNFIDTVNRGLINMTTLQLRAIDFLARAVGKTSNLEDQFSESLAEEVRRNNAAASGSSYNPASLYSPANNAGTGSGALGGGFTSVGSGGSGISGSSGSSVYAADNRPGVALRDITQAQFARLSASDQQRAINAGFNPYAGGSYATPAPFYGTNPETNLPQLARTLSKMNVSDAVRVRLQSYLSRQMTWGNGTSPWRSNGLVEGAGGDLVDQYGAGSWERDELGRIFGSEFSRLTGGSRPQYDSSGNAIIYVTIDGKEIAEAMVSKLALLGVKT
jgi:hypothetical protein